MSTLFIADLHLSSDEPAITAGFLAFLKREAIYADALYILGDLFEVWIGDDEPSSLHDAVADAIGDLHQYNVPCYFIHGNRDFLLGKRFAERSHIVLLPQESAISVYGHNVLILHGDTLCTDDKEYQKFRAKMYNPILRRLFFCLPLKLRQRIGATLRNQSKNKNSLKAATIMDVNENAVIERFMLHQTHCMIHGHTHRPAIHDIVLQDDHYYRIVLGAWHDKGSVLKFSPEFKFELVSFPLDKR